MHIACVHLIISGDNPEQTTVYDAFLKKEDADELADKVAQVSGKPCRVLSLALSDGRLKEIVARLDSLYDGDSPANGRAIDKSYSDLAAYIVKCSSEVQNV